MNNILSSKIAAIHQSFLRCDTKQTWVGKLSLNILENTFNIISSIVENFSKCQFGSRQSVGTESFTIADRRLQFDLNYGVNHYSGLERSSSSDFTRVSTVSKRWASTTLNIFETWKNLKVISRLTKDWVVQELNPLLQFRVFIHSIF